MLELGDAALDAKLAALDSHESQIGPLRTRLGDDFRRLFATEAYRPANVVAWAYVRSTVDAVA